MKRAETVSLLFLLLSVSVSGYAAGYSKGEELDSRDLVEAVLAHARSWSTSFAALEAPSGKMFIMHDPDILVVLTTGRAGMNDDGPPEEGKLFYLMWLDEHKGIFPCFSGSVENKYSHFLDKLLAPHQVMVFEFQ